MRPGRLPPERMYPAGAAGVATRHVTLPGGLTLRVAESGPRHEGRCVILLHGWAASLYSFAETIPAVAGAGYRVVAIDLPGFGLSDKPADERKYCLEYLATSLELAAYAVGARRFTLVAHSMAGAIALQHALRGVSGLERLVLINPVGLGRVPVIQPLSLASRKIMDVLVPPLLTRGLVRTILRVAFATPQRPTERDVDEYWAPSQFDEYTTACRACLRHFAWKPLQADVLRGLSMPVLVLVGARDRLVRDVEERARSIPSARIVTIAEGGHIVMQECAERTNHAIIRFLRDWD